MFRKYFKNSLQNLIVCLKIFNTVGHMNIYIELLMSICKTEMIQCIRIYM